jgi:hypothetical protein
MITTKEEETYLKGLKKVFGRLKNYKCCKKSKKCSFLKNKKEF